VDSVAVVAVVPAESAIAGRRLTLIEQAKGCHESMAPFFCLFFADTSAEETSKVHVAVDRRGVRDWHYGAVFYCRELIETTAS
jgi:hypothetical protein